MNMLASEKPLKEKAGAELKRPLKRKSSGNPKSKAEQNNNVKRLCIDSKEDMLAAYQPWVLQTYGDLAKTKTITLKKYARILRTLRGDEVVSADNSKFRFWVKAKGFHVGQPANYEAKPADAIVGRFSVCDLDDGIPPADVGSRGSARDPPLYVPNAPFKNTSGEPVYRKVAVVENFFDIIYNVHVELEGRPGKHAGQKRTYRTITETYAFLPREAVTRFLLGCTECQKHPRSPSPVSVLPTPSPSPTLPLLGLPAPHNPTQTPHTPLSSRIPESDQPVYLDISNSIPERKSPLHINVTTSSAQPITLNLIQRTPEPQLTPSTVKIEQSFKIEPDVEQQIKVEHTLKIEQTERQKKSSNPLDVSNLTSKDPPKTPPKKRLTSASSTPKLWSPVREIKEERKRHIDEIDFTMPITTTYLKYMRSLGCTDEDALKFENKTKLEHENERLVPSFRDYIQTNGDELKDPIPMPDSSENTEEDHYSGSGQMKDADKLKLMLLAWNYHSQSQGARNGNSEVPDLSSLPGGEEMAGLWAQYHNALGLAKGKATPPATRDQLSPVNAETSSAHDETSSSGNKEDEDDDDDESDDKIDTQTHDPERLKAFNMFVRLFVDENLDRMVPISKQPKEKIQAIIDSCTRQFPEFAERARKRIRTYLKSCRRNKRARDPNSPWDVQTRTPAHLTSVQAEQILATACENESHNAKRMRLGMEPVSQPMPLLPGATPTDTTAMSRGLDYSGNPVKMETDTTNTVFGASNTPSSTPNSITKGMSHTPDIKPTALSVSSSLSSTAMNGIGISSTAGSAPTAMYRPNFSQAFQRAGPYPLFPGPFGNTGGLLTNGPTDLSMKQKPLLNHKLNAGEMAAVRQLITGYRESAAFLLRSADELEQLLHNQP